MTDIARLHSGFTRFTPEIRLGHLASDMHRLASWAANSDDEAAILELMRETAWKMEWLGDAATEDVANMQRELCRWMRAWPLGSARSVLAFRAERMSATLLDMSGMGAARQA